MSEEYMDSYQSEIVKDLLKEQREQKRIGSGAIHRASRKKGYKGQVKFVYETLKGKAKKEYMNNGKVERYFLFEKDINQLKPYEEIFNMPLEEGNEYLTNVKMFYKTKQLKEYWGVSQGKYYYLLEKFGISHINRKPKTKKGKVKNEVSEPNPKATPKQTEKSNMFMDSLITEQINKAIEMHLNNINNKPKEETNNIITSKTGIIHGERLYTLLIKMADFLDRNENYDILFKIKEK